MDRARLAACGIAALLLAALTGPARSQQIEQGVAIVSEAIASRVDGFAYRPDSTSQLDFRGTSLAPRADGSAKIKTGSELTEINAKFEHLPAPASFGPLAVYVLWVVTPEGRASNVGVINVSEERGSLNATTPLSSFALIVTAEPHFAVSIPSKYIVLLNVGGNVQGTQLVVTSLAARADYGTLKPIVADPKHRAPLELDMAHYAVAIAEASGAAELAPQAFQRARDGLSAAESAATAKSSSTREHAPGLAREAIQAAEDARAAAQSRTQAADMDRLRQQISDRDAKAQETAELADKQRQDSSAAQGLLTSQLQQCSVAMKQLQRRLPNRASRLQEANALLSRWLVLDADDQTITAHLASDGFSKGHVELTTDSKDRLSTAAGILLGIGNLSITVTPALQLSEDVKQLGLSQQRARAIMEWLASLGLKANAGVPADQPAAVQRALAPGPGVDLLITFEDAADGSADPKSAGS